MTSGVPRIYVPSGEDHDAAVCCIVIAEWVSCLALSLDGDVEYELEQA
jgi:hypothetical protein